LGVTPVISLEDICFHYKQLGYFAKDYPEFLKSHMNIKEFIKPALNFILIQKKTKPKEEVSLLDLFYQDPNNWPLI